MISRNVGTSIVPKNAPRKAVVDNGVIYRFGYEPLSGTNMCKCTEVLLVRVPDVSVIEDLFRKYEQANSVFTAADYGY